MPRPVIILGPTAGGKSELAVALAERLPEQGEVLGADSMQVYRHLDAGTAKPSRGLRQRVPHHLIDIVEPTERFTVADWVERADALIEDIQARNKRPIIVGGTNLYLKVLLEGMFDAPAQDARFRAELEPIDTHELHERLKETDPAAAARIHPNDRKRIVRALEVHHLTGKPISEQQQQWRDQSAEKPETRSPKPETTYRHNPILIGLDWPADAINRRINQRVKHMFHPHPTHAESERSEGSDHAPQPESLPDEVRRLEQQNMLGAPGPPGSQPREALGYKQVLAYLHRQCKFTEAFEQTKIQTRRFAKQQRTWLRRFRGVHWLPAAELSPDQLTDRALDIVRHADRLENREGREGAKDAKKG